MGALHHNTTVLPMENGAICLDLADPVCGFLLAFSHFSVNHLGCRIMFGILQMQAGPSPNAIMRVSCLLSLVCGVTGLLLSCVFLLRMDSLAKGYEVAGVWVKVSRTFYLCRIYLRVIV